MLLLTHFSLFLSVSQEPEINHSTLQPQCRYFCEISRDMKVRRRKIAMFASCGFQRDKTGYQPLCHNLCKIRMVRRQTLGSRLSDSSAYSLLKPWPLLTTDGYIVVFHDCALNHTQRGEVTTEFFCIPVQTTYNNINSQGNLEKY